MPPHHPHILITGGSRGIGLAIAQLFAANSYRCTLVARSESSLQSAVASLPSLPSSRDRDAEDPGHAYIAAPVTSRTLWSSAGEFGQKFPRPRLKPPVSSSSEPVHAQYASRIDVLVNCAGISQSKLFTALGDEELEQLVDTNLTSLMRGTRWLLRQGYLRAPAPPPADGGSHEGRRSSPVIINISSLLGTHGGHGAVAYAASKAGVLGFTRALATEYAATGVRVNAVVPGYVETGMTRELNTAAQVGRIPLGRFGRVEEVADAVWFLVRNEYAHHCVLGLDGGLSAV